MIILKKSKVVKIILVLILLIFLYSFFVFNKLIDYSKDLKKVFDGENLNGKNVNEVIKVYGFPSNVNCYSYLDYDMKLENYRVGDPYCKLTYYTDNSLLNSIGWFPGGGTRIYVDKNSNVTKFKQYLE